MFQGRCSQQTALERQDLSCTYQVHHDLESVFILNIFIASGPQEQVCLIHQAMFLWFISSLSLAGVLPW